MQTLSSCAGCGGPLPPGRLAAFCTGCLLTAALTPLPDEPFADPDAPEDEPAPASLRVGDYELLEPIAQGGMGTVWRARQISAGRVVAYKTVASGRLAGAAERRRFQTEIEAAARLDHPGIVPIYEVGEDEGRPFFTMRLMEGGTLADREMGEGESEKPTGPSFSPFTSARLLAKVARAVHFAHERGILHRDLKPGNILLDAAGEPFVADFGLARRLEDASNLTLSGDVLGTPAYLAPEVAADGSRAATIASDVYALGAILYELLAGQPPFQAQTVPALLRKIAEEEPLPPSQALRQRPAANNPVGADVRRLKLPVVQSLLTSAPTVAKGPQHSAFKDLETICLKCLAKNPAARYPSAAALADDLDRWLGGEPIQARSATLVEVGVRWARRHRVGAALLGVAALLPALIIAGLLWANAYSAREREQTRLNLYAADMALAATAIEQGNFGQAGQLLAGHEPRPGQRDLRGFEWHWLRQQARGDAQAQFQPFTNAVLQLAVSPDGRWLAAGANGHQHTWVLDAVEDRVAARPESRLPPGDAMSLAFSADGQWLAGGGRGVTLWQVPAFRFSAQTNLHTYWAYFLPGAENLLLVSHRDPIEGRQWWDKANRLTLFNSALERVKDFGEATNYYGSLSRDGGTLVAYDYNRATVWDTTNATVLKQFTTTIGFHRIALSPDGRRAAILYQMRPTVELWDPRAGERLGEFVGSKANPHCVDFSPDGRLLATGAGDELIRLWDVDTRQEVRRLRGHHLGVASVAFFPDGNRLASGGDDGGVRLWDLTPPTARENPATNLAPPLVFSADGRQLAAGLRTGGLGIWETDSRRLLRAWPDVELASLAARPGAEGFLLLGREGTGQTNLRVFSCSAASDALQPAGPLAFAPGAATLLALSPDGATCLSGHTNGQVRWWDVASGRLTADVPGHSHPLWRAGFSADGRRAVTTTQFPNTFRAWSAAPPRALGTNYFPGRSGLQCLVLSPDGRQCVTGGRRLGFHIWNTDDFTPLATFPAQRAEVHQLAWSPDGQTLATASLDGKLRLWHLPTRRPLLTLQDRPTTEPRLVALAFSPDGQWLAACDAGGELHLWPAPRQELRRAAK